MFGPGEYVPDATEGIVDVNDLTKPIFVSEDHNDDHSPCPRCGQLAYCHQCAQRSLHDLGDLKTGRPIALLVTYASPYGSRCRKDFNVDLSDLAFQLCPLLLIEKR